MKTHWMTIYETCWPHIISGVWLHQISRIRIFHAPFWDTLCSSGWRWYLPSFFQYFFIQLHPLQLHVVHFLEGTQFSGMMTLPLIRFSEHWLSYRSNPLVQLQLRWVSHPVGPLRWAWVRYSLTPKWVDDTRALSKGTPPWSVNQNITHWRPCQGHQKEHWSGCVPSEWEKLPGVCMSNRPKQSP